MKIIYLGTINNGNPHYDIEIQKKDVSILQQQLTEKDLKTYPQLFRELFKSIGIDLKIYLFLKIKEKRKINK